MARKKTLQESVPAAPPNFVCPYEPSPYAIRRYGYEVCRSLLSFIQICVHGLTCDKCCHMYTWKFAEYTEINDIPGNFTINNRLTKKIVPTYYDIIFGCNYPERTFSIKHLCGEHLCLNTQHWSITIFNNQYYKINRDLYIDEHVALYSRKCYHGSECKECCFIWNGRIDKDSPAMYVSGKEDITSISVTKYIGQEYIQNIRRDQAFYQRCKNTICINYEHLYVDTSTFYTEETKKLLLEKRNAVFKRNKQNREKQKIENTDEEFSWMNEYILEPGEEKKWMKYYTRNSVNS